MHLATYLTISTGTVIVQQIIASLNRATPQERWLGALLAVLSWPVLVPVWGIQAVLWTVARLIGPTAARTVQALPEPWDPLLEEVQALEREVAERTTTAKRLKEIAVRDVAQALAAARKRASQQELEDTAWQIAALSRRRDYFDRRYAHAPVITLDAKMCPKCRGRLTLDALRAITRHGDEVFGYEARCEDCGHHAGYQPEEARLLLPYAPAQELPAFDRAVWYQEREQVYVRLFGDRRAYARRTKLSGPR